VESTRVDDLLGDLNLGKKRLNKGLEWECVKSGEGEVVRKKLRDCAMADDSTACRSNNNNKRNNNNCGLLLVDEEDYDDDIHKKRGEGGGDNEGLG